MNKLLILPVALACTGAIASSNIPITGSVESKCVIQTDTDGVYGNPTADKLSTAVADGGVLPIVRYDIVTANAYKAVISHPDSFSSSPTLTDTVSWTGSTTLTNSSDSNMSAFNDNKVTYNNSSEFDLTVAGSAWFSVTSTAEYGYDKAFPAGTYSAMVTAECIAQ
tara:strand:+ start:1331 stop:1828 length:498 start_codon:yes stop_codon:yes gene_type:complete